MGIKNPRWVELLFELVLYALVHAVQWCENANALVLVAMDYACLKQGDMPACFACNFTQIYGLRGWRPQPTLSAMPLYVLRIGQF